MLSDLQISSDIWDICHNINAKISKVIPWTYSGEHEKLFITSQSCVHSQIS